LRNKGNKYYQNAHGNIFRKKTNTKLSKKKQLLKRMRTPKIPALNKSVQTP
jgi:hypothetical protein